MDRERRFSRGIMIAWLVWAVSLLLPAAGVRAEGELMRHDFFLPGWQVALIAVFDGHRGVHAATRLAIRAMGLTNLIMLTSPITAVAGRRSMTRTFAVLAVGAGCLNASALLFNFASMLAWGYWIWLASFGMLARALWRDRPPARPF
jgi:hypothetical protein